MRAVFALGLIFLGLTTARAQEQEKKLLDRLLKPDMSLQNDAQGKQFTAGGATLDKKAPTKNFYVAERKAERGFWNTRQVSSKEFPTESSRFSKTEANLGTRSKIQGVDTPYPTPGYGGVHDAVDAGKTVPVSEYSGSRPFLVRGKSQKSLSAQDKPMTIDQVRELLNKNK